MTSDVKAKSIVAVNVNVNVNVNSVTDCAFKRKIHSEQTVKQIDHFSTDQDLADGLIIYQAI